jgi:Tol biopolymer transport system component
VLRRRALACAAGVCLLGLVVPALAPATPAGPRLAFIRGGDPLPGDELLATDPSGERWSRLWRTPHSSGFFSDLTWAGDGSRIALSVTPTDFDVLPLPYIGAIPAGGGKPVEVRGTKGGLLPVFSPDGRTLAFARIRIRARKGERGGVTIVGALWLADANGGGSRLLTPWRRDVALFPVSFTPDGTGLVTVRQRIGERPEVVTLSLTGGPPIVLPVRGSEFAVSPDGSKIAFVRLKKVGSSRSFAPFPIPVWGGDLFVTSLDGSPPRRLTFSPGRRESEPDWDPSGERLAYVQHPAKRTVQALNGEGTAIVEINADGSCRHKLLFTYGLSYREPAWQPGPGRGAGRIEC